MEKKENIIVYNAYENNLKNINVSIPLNKFVCIIGPSGCGKSSLVYDTIYAESQRNFLESMSNDFYNHKLMDKPRVDYIENLPPALNISQKYYNVNPRSTIGTVTDVSYYLRAMFALVFSQDINLKIDSNYFSPNNSGSCCKECDGTGESYVVSKELLMPDKSKTLAKGGIIYYKGAKTSMEYKLLEAVCSHFNIDINTKICELTEREIKELLFREEELEFKLRFKTSKGKYRQKNIRHCGVVVELNKQILNIDIPSIRIAISKFITKDICKSCNGLRLKKDILALKICGKNISEVENLRLEQIGDWLEEVKTHYINKNYKEQINQLTIEIFKRINMLIELKVKYLSLDRNIPSLSGGEVQRIRLANQLTCCLSGILYILDEPCKGLHFKDIESIISATNKLISKGNSVIAIEHNKQYISQANKIIELGPTGGICGGYIVSEIDEVKDYVYDIDFKKVVETKNYIKLKNINFRNLKEISIDIPIGKITCISGVSGSGKSSIAHVILECCEKNSNVHCEKLDIPIKFRRVIHIDQKQIGKTPRSTVISYLGIYDLVRKLFAGTNVAKNLGLTISDFSMNVEGGRCETCQGTGKIKIQLSYLPDSYIKCSTCGGRRFNEKILSVKYKGLNIDDVLSKSIDELGDLFIDIEGINSVLECMKELGLGYISLGQMSMTLSGGESQRIKLAKHLGVKSNGDNLYVIDEPTIGLNEHDIKLIAVIIEKMQGIGDTIIVIEHNIEFIANVADYIIDLGINPGDSRKNTLVQGYPKDVVRDCNSSWYGIV